ncbi:2-nitropropane dioxygenase [Tatumella morbirosei]|uniref:Nitronate monooxygenase n=1 Tax=Tatumella morbirosei TaxID=642227 RepID=A0A095T6K8_9GAMM|nr:nitronate monooxygenase [Tatumella morbirosei]KGD72164.1 2-nitropropane dioxygenase [Tatumella morbirosei]
MKSLLADRLGLGFPLIQAPMAGVSTPALAAAVSNAGALGSVSIGAVGPEQAEKMISTTLAQTRQAVNVNLFCHAVAVRNLALEAEWLQRFQPLFNQFGVSLPDELTEIYTSFLQQEKMVDILLAQAPAAVSFHFGLPEARVIEKFRQQGIVTLATVTSVEEALIAQAAGVEFLIAQGIEAGGHRGIFDMNTHDQMLTTRQLILQLKKSVRLPLIAAGGIMHGAGIQEMLNAGADAVQMGTAFVLCPESSADAAYRQALKQETAGNTVLTRAVSGRPARSLNTLFCRLTADIQPQQIPDYPLTYSLNKALAAAAASQGEVGFSAQWAGEGAWQAREMSAASLVATLIKEAGQAGYSAT